MNIDSFISPSDYIRVDSLPEAWRREFADWLWRQTCPVIKSELDADGMLARCAYRWDYEHWLATFWRGEVAMPLD